MTIGHIVGLENHDRIVWKFSNQFHYIFSNKTQYYTLRENRVGCLL